MNILKKILAIWISIYLIIVPPFAHAASAGGWSFSAFDVATSVVTAVKNGASASVAVAKSPISTKIAKGIVGGAIAGAVIPLAISQLSGIALNAVDWVLDPANNAIKYRSTDTTPQFSCTSPDFAGQTFKSEQSLIDAVKKRLDAAGTGYTAIKYENGSVLVNTTNYGWTAPYMFYCDTVAPNNDWKTIPIPTVADKIYDNAKTDTASASIVNDAVKDYVNEGSADVALDTAKAETDATHGCGNGTSWNGSACVADTPSTPDTPFDPTDIIDAIGKVFDAVMSLPDVINSALDALLADIKDFFQPVIDTLTDFVDWVKATPQDTGNDEVVVSDSPTPPFDIDSLALKPYISLPAECPANPAWNFMGGQIVLPLNIVCDGFSMASWLVMAFAWLRGLVIVGSTFKG